MGFLLFSVGNLFAIGGLTLAATGHVHGSWGPWVITSVAVGELLIMASVLFLGNDGYRRMEARTSAMLGRRNDAVTDPTSNARLTLGLLLLLAHLATYFIVWTGGIVAYARATVEAPFPSVFGLSFEQQGPAFVWGVIAAELLFATAIYALGPAWWERFRTLFLYQAPTAAAEPDAPKPPSTLRYRLGLGVFALGNLLAISGLILPAVGLAQGRMVGVIAVMLGAGEVISLSSIFLLGKEGFKELKGRVFAVLKRTPSGQAISRRRHRVGVSFLALHVLSGFAALIFPIASHYGVSSDGAFPTVLGLDRPQQLQWFLALLITSEAFFFIGVYTLGGAWWGRFQSLFQKGV